MSQLHRISGCENADRKMDVVFIHGLGGDAIGTWRHGRDESTSWPHWVGAEHSDVGVWSLGYAASPSTWARLRNWFGRASRDAGYAMSLPDRARQVANLMVQKRLGQRPLILVGHSLGGLLTKQLLRYCADPGSNDALRAVADATRAVLFLGTPHTGAALATLGDQFRSVFGATVAIENLRAHDPHLRELYDWYRNSAPRLRIETATYYESRGVAGGVVTIVNPTSSHPGVGSDPIPLDEDHLTLAKPRERDAQVCDALRALIAGVRSEPRPATPPVPPLAPISVPPPAAPSAPAIVVHVNTPTGATAPPRAPRELPPRAEHYFGRPAERERLAQRLRERRNTAVVGPGGLGKTALAAETLHAMGDAALEALYPDGSLYVDLYATHANRDAIWSRLANQLEGSGFMEQASPQVRAEEACRGRRLLLIVEGCEEADGQDGHGELAELLSVIPVETVRLLLTRQATQAMPAESIQLHEALAPDDAAALLDTLSGDRVIGNDRDRLLALLAGHPLALTWAGNLLARDDEHPDALLRDWTTAVLPPLTDPTNNTHTLRWLYDRSARGLNTDAKRILDGAGLLAHAPIPLALIEVVIEGDDRQHRARIGLRTLVRAGLMRIEAALPDHWQFAHVLAYRYAQDQAAAADALARALAERLHATLTADCARADEPEIRTRVARSLDHAAVLLRAAPLADDAGWKLIANSLLYDWQAQLLARGRSDLARYALDAVEAWMDVRPAAESEKPDSLREYGMLQNRRGDLLILQGDLPGGEHVTKKRWLSPSGLPRPTQATRNGSGILASASTSSATCTRRKMTCRAHRRVTRLGWPSRSD